MARGVDAREITLPRQTIRKTCQHLVKSLPPLRFGHYDESMSFSDTIFLFFLALVLFGPKKLPEMARQAGKLLAELRRASNEFRSQIETEISQLEADKKPTVLPSTPAPLGAVPSMTPVSGMIDAARQRLNSPEAAAADTAATPPAALSGSTPAAESVVGTSPATSQGSNV